MSKWYKEWFQNQAYLDVYSHRNDDDAGRLLDTILKNIELPPNALVLDAACGAGRHAVLLTRRGFDVIGFDLSMPLLKIANENRLKLGLEIQYINSDMREVLFKDKFGLILNVFTSFGYFDSDEENFQFIKNSYSFLLPGGYFVFDFFNSDYITANLVENSEKETNGIKIFEKRKIEKGRIIKEIQLVKDGKVSNFTESVRLFNKEKIIPQFENAGYKIEKVFGDYNGNDFNRQKSERLIIISRK